MRGLMSALSFRPLTGDDFPLLSRWLAQPHVAQTEWGQEHDPSPEAVEADFGGCVDGLEPTEMLIMLENEQSVGLIQSYRLGDYPQWLAGLEVVSASPDAIGIDYLVGELDATGRGLGPELIRRFVNDIWQRYENAPTVLVAVYQDNPASWRALEKAGFNRTWSGVLLSDTTKSAIPSYVYEIPRR